MFTKLNELRNRKEEGFTLIELLVVILIIGVLSAIALPIFLNQQAQAACATLKSDIRNTNINITAMYVANPEYMSNRDGTYLYSYIDPGKTSQGRSQYYKISQSNTGNSFAVWGFTDKDGYTIRGSNSVCKKTFEYESNKGKTTEVPYVPVPRNG